MRRFMLRLTAVVVVLCAVLCALLCAVGCGEQPLMKKRSEKEIRRAARTHESSSAGLAKRVGNPPGIHSPQERDAPFMPGYNARGETAPLRTMKDVVANIREDWEDIEDIVASHPEDATDPYDYEGLAEVGSRLVMRAEELRKARKFELSEARVAPETHKPDEVDHDIDLFAVNAGRLRSAAAKRQPEVIDEVLFKMPGAVPRFLGGSTGR